MPGKRITLFLEQCLAALGTVRSLFFRIASPGQSGARRFAPRRGTVRQPADASTEDTASHEKRGLRLSIYSAAAHASDPSAAGLAAFGAELQSRICTRTTLRPNLQASP